LQKLTKVTNPALEILLEIITLRVIPASPPACRLPRRLPATETDYPVFV